jgi:hypothetical protein
MTITEQVLTADERQEELRHLARNWQAFKPAVQQVKFRWLAHPLLPPPASIPCTCGKCAVCIWEAYQHDLALLDGLRREAWAEPRDWHDVDEELAGTPDPEGEAIRIAEALVAEAEGLLLYGERRRQAGAA